MYMFYPLWIAWCQKVRGHFTSFCMLSNMLAYRWENSNSGRVLFAVFFLLLNKVVCKLLSEDNLSRNSNATLSRKMNSVGEIHSRLLTLKMYHSKARNARKISVANSLNKTEVALVSLNLSRMSGMLSLLNVISHLWIHSSEGFFYIHIPSISCICFIWTRMKT